MPRYTINGVEAPINPISATSPASIAVTAKVVAADQNLQILSDEKKAQLKKDKEAADAAANAPGASSPNTKLLVVGAAVVGLVGWLVLKDQKKRSSGA